MTKSNRLLAPAVAYAAIVDPAPLGLGVTLATDFFSLTGDQLAKLTVFADNMRYRAPANANGSRLRYFHAYLVRQAEKVPAKTLRQAAYV